MQRDNQGKARLENCRRVPKAQDQDLQVYLGDHPAQYSVEHPTEHQGNHLEEPLGSHPGEILSNHLEEPLGNHQEEHPSDHQELARALNKDLKKLIKVQLDEIRDLLLGAQLGQQQNKREKQQKKHINENYSEMFHNSHGFFARDAFVAKIRTLHIELSNTACVTLIFLLILQRLYTNIKFSVKLLVTIYYLY